MIVVVLICARPAGSSASSSSAIVSVFARCIIARDHSSDTDACSGIERAHEAGRKRTAFEQGGELSAAVELRRLFPGVSDNAEAREGARTIAAWWGASQTFAHDRLNPSG
jgi:hypothetical protein